MIANRLTRNTIAAVLVTAVFAFGGERSITVKGILRTGPTGVNTTTNPDLIGIPVTSVLEFIPGNEVYLELWVTTDWSQGLTGVGLDVAYDESFLSTSTAQVSLNSSWGLLAYCPSSEECVPTPGLVSNVGGNNLSGLPASTGLWERIATIEFDVTSVPDPCTGFGLFQDGAMLFAFFGGGLALPEEVEYIGLGVPGPDFIDDDGDFVIDCVDNCPSVANPSQSDCDNDGVGDACVIADGIDTDCNENTIPDMCDIDAGAVDDNNNNFPDECETCIRDCDCFTDTEGNLLPYFTGACEYRYCLDNLCRTCERRFGNTCAPFAALVQTSDILCTVSGFGNYCACPNGDVWDSSAPGCSPSSPENCEGPSGRPITTADILASVSAFGGENPFSCPCITNEFFQCEFSNGCDQAPLPPTGGCGAVSVSAASGGLHRANQATARRQLHTPSGNSPVTISVVPRTRRVQPGGLVFADVFVSGQTKLSALQLAFDARGNGIGSLDLVDIDIDVTRSDYLFRGGNSLAVPDLVLWRVGTVDTAGGAALFDDEQAYVATFVFAASEQAGGTFDIHPAIDMFELWAELGTPVDFEIASTPTIVVQRSTRR